MSIFNEINTRLEGALDGVRSLGHHEWVVLKDGSRFPARHNGREFTLPNTRDIGRGIVFWMTNDDTAQSDLIPGGFYQVRFPFTVVAVVDRKMIGDTDKAPIKLGEIVLGALSSSRWRIKDTSAVVLRSVGRKYGLDVVGSIFSNNLDFEERYAYVSVDVDLEYKVREDCLADSICG